MCRNALTCESKMPMTEPRGCLCTTKASTCMPSSAMVAFIETARKVLVLVIVTKIIGICCGPSHRTGDGVESHEDDMPYCLKRFTLNFPCGKPSESREGRNGVPSNQIHEKKSVISARRRGRGRGPRQGARRHGRVGPQPEPQPCLQAPGRWCGFAWTRHNLKPQLRGEFGSAHNKPVLTISQIVARIYVNPRRGRGPRRWPIRKVTFYKRKRACNRQTATTGGRIYRAGGSTAYTGRCRRTRIGARSPARSQQNGNTETTLMHTSTS